MKEGKIYKYISTKEVCYIFQDKTFLGVVWIDNSGAWNAEYQKDVKYLPINSALKVLGYSDEVKELE